MLKITLPNNDSFILKTEMAELTIAEYIEFNKKFSAPPEDNLGAMVKYEWEVIQFLSGIPDEYAANIGADDLDALFVTATQFLQIVPEPIDSFVFGGKQYRCAEKVLTNSGAELPMGEITTEEYLEASSLLKVHDELAKEVINNDESIPKIVSILFREVDYVGKRRIYARGRNAKYKIRTYNEKDATERQKAFMSLPADIALGAYFFLSPHQNASVRRYVNYVGKKKTRQRKFIISTYKNLGGILKWWRRSLQWATPWRKSKKVVPMSSSSTAPTKRPYPKPTKKLAK